MGTALPSGRDPSSRQRNSLSTFHLDMNTTLQHYLHQAGYQTWISGKFLNGWQYTRPGGFSRSVLTARHTMARTSRTLLAYNAPGHTGATSKSHLRQSAHG